MEKIKSFTVDHDHLEPGIYISEVNGDITTYDLRVVKPNTPPFLGVSAMHTIEHIFATFARNSDMKDDIIYFGPMGCRTGFNLLVRNADDEKVIKLIQETVVKVADFSGTIPGSGYSECGNYLEHDLRGAKREMAAYSVVIRNWKKERLEY